MLIGSHTVFYRTALKDEELDRVISDTDSKGRTPSQTMSRVLQELRDQGIIEFLDNHGTYRLLR